ncbi:erythromycin resistance leader peptide [Catenovulum sediminis]|uniref:Erythromycin resistance leader peptide n=1 Tax=Catenovulum sediminis TaxID=1740262 RepID=A0ABV1RI89_9ALTE
MFSIYLINKVRYTRGKAGS